MEQSRTSSSGFVVPPQKSLRDQYYYELEPIPSGSQCVMGTLRVRVFRRPTSGGRAPAMVAVYDRNYHNFNRTFEPFRQGGRDYALASSEYTGTAVLDLETGKIIAAEEPDPHGFCPVDFYVPDWWDVHDGLVMPGSQYWSEKHERPRGDFGLVAGCYWGGELHVQYLDLSRITEGVITRDDRFGHAELAPGLTLREAVRFEDRNVNCMTLAVPSTFDLKTGKLLRWALEDQIEDSLRERPAATESEPK